MASSFPLESDSNALASRVVSILATVLGTIIVSFCLGQRAHTFDLFSRRGLSSMTISRFWLLFLLVDSLFFLVASGLLMQGVGLIRNPAGCNAIQLICISFYFISKGAAYSLFLEKVYAVWPNRGSRLTSTAYKVGLVALICFLCLIVVFLVGRNTHIRDDGECVIGSSESITLVVLLVDVAVNALLTGLFLVPLMRYTILCPQVRQVAVRNFTVSTVCFLSSATNLIALAALRGHEVAWVCVASCSVDITINAVAAFWVTRPAMPPDSTTDQVSTSWTVGWMHTCEMDADEAILSRFDGQSPRIDSRSPNDREVATRGVWVDRVPDSHSSLKPTYYSGTRSLPPIAFNLPTMKNDKEGADESP